MAHVIGPGDAPPEISGHFVSDRTFKILRNGGEIGTFKAADEEAALVKCLCLYNHPNIASMAKHERRDPAELRQEFAIFEVEAD